MTMEEVIRNEIGEILEIEDIGSLDKDVDLKEYGMDSLNAIEIVVALETEFGIEFEEEDLLLDNLCSIQKLIEVVTRLEGK